MITAFDDSTHPDLKGSPQRLDVSDTIPESPDACHGSRLSVCAGSHSPSPRFCSGRSQRPPVLDRDMTV